MSNFDRLTLEDALRDIQARSEEQTRRRKEGRKRGDITEGLIDRLRNCNPAQLHKAIRTCLRFLKDHRTAPAAHECSQRFRRTIILSVSVGNQRYQLEKRPCGKGCNQCPHGPYLYAYQRDGAIIKQRYIGKAPYGKIPRKLRAALRHLE
jgi:hypothetical protein